MPESLRQVERETYEAIWALPAYAERSPGEQYLPLFLDMAHPDRRDSFLDAGCGAGKTALALVAQGYPDVRLCDLTDAGLSDEARTLPFDTACLWEPLMWRVDWVICTDVLEHIPTPFTMLVVSRLLEVAKKGVFLSISLMPDQFGAWVGKPLHQTVQTFAQWRDQLAALGRVTACRDLLHCGVYLVESR